MSFSFQGILVTLLVLGILIAIHESGHFLAAKSIKVPVREFAIGFGPRIFGFTWGETECRLNWIPLGGYCAFMDDERDDAGELLTGPDDKMLRNRSVSQRLWVVSAGVIFNYVSAWIILFASCLGLGIPSGNQTVGVRAVMPGTPAAAVGLQANDRIVSLDHKTFVDFPAFQTQLSSYKGHPVTLGLMRDNKPLNLVVTPNSEGKLGFRPSVHEEMRPVSGPIEAITAASQREGETTAMLCTALYQLFTSPATMMDKTGGPVQIVAMGDQIYQDDPWQLLTFAVILSVELAIINLLPLPALDGGHIVLLLLEKLRGKALPRRIEEKILVAGFAVIMGMGMLLIVKDLMTVPGMYKHQPPAATSPAPAKP